MRWLVCWFVGWFVGTPYFLWKNRNLGFLDPVEASLLLDVLESCVGWFVG